MGGFKRTLLCVTSFFERMIILPRKLVAEMVGTAFLLATVVGSGVTAAYWFTASTSFANPAVTIGRAFTDSFSGIRPTDMPAFIVAQLLGAVVAVMLAAYIFTKREAD